MTLFELDPGPLPTTPPPKLSRDARRTARNRRLMADGIHPATYEPLLHAEWGYKCADCVHSERVCTGARWVWKCALHRLGMSRSEASDIRVSWPACDWLRIDAP